MKTYYEIKRKNSSNFDCFNLTKFEINIFKKKETRILSNVFLPNIFQYCIDKNIKALIKLYKNNDFIGETKLEKFDSNEFKFISQILFSEIFEQYEASSVLSSLSNLYNLKTYCSHYEASIDMEFSNYWYIETCSALGKKSYKLFPIVKNKQKACLINTTGLEDIINDYIRNYHKQYELGPNAYVVVNDWNNNLTSKKLPLKFNTPSLIKLLTSNKSIKTENEVKKESEKDLMIIPYIDLQNKTIYIVSTHNKVGMTNIENVLKESILVVCNPIKYDIIKNGWTLNLLNNIIESVEIELPSMYKKDNFKIELMF